MQRHEICMQLCIKWVRYCKRCVGAKDSACGDDGVLGRDVVATLGPCSGLLDVAKLATDEGNLQVMEHCSNETVTVEI